MSKKKIKELVEENLRKSGFVKQSFGEFDNYFLDKVISLNKDMYRDLRLTANLSREEIADLVGLSVYSIRKYESHWDNAEPPKWYYLMLRLVNGDLSFFGKKWRGFVIQHHDRKLRTHFSNKAMEPFEMFSQYNRVALDARKELRIEQQKISELEIRINSLESELSQAQLQNEILSNKIDRLKALKSLTETGKVIPLFAKS